MVWSPVFPMFTRLFLFDVVTINRVCLHSLWVPIALTNLDTSKVDLKNHILCLFLHWWQLYNIYTMCEVFYPQFIPLPVRNRIKMIYYFWFGFLFEHLFSVETWDCTALHSGKVPMGEKPLALSDSVTQITTKISVPRTFSGLWGLPTNVYVCLSFCFYVFLSVSLYKIDKHNKHNWTTHLR